MQKTWIIECPTNLGLAKNPGIEQPGVSKLPAWLRECQFHHRIQPEKILSVSAPPYRDELDEISGIKNADEIRAYAIRQADELKKAFAAGVIPLIIGGDCSILIGNTLALKQVGRYGLFFLDGHTDFGRPSISSSKAAALLPATAMKNLAIFMTYLPISKNTIPGALGVETSTKLTLK